MVGLLLLFLVQDPAAAGGQLPEIVVETEVVEGPSSINGQGWCHQQRPAGTQPVWEFRLVGPATMTLLEAIRGHEVSRVRVTQPVGQLLRPPDQTEERTDIVDSVASLLTSNLERRSLTRFITWSEGFFGGHRLLVEYTDGRTGHIVTNGMHSCFQTPEGDVWFHRWWGGFPRNHTVDLEAGLRLLLPARFVLNQGQPHRICQDAVCEQPLATIEIRDQAEGLADNVVVGSRWGSQQIGEQHWIFRLTDGEGTYVTTSQGKDVVVWHRDTDALPEPIGRDLQWMLREMRFVGP